MAVNVLLDTNAYTRLLSGETGMVRIVSLASKIYLPVVVLDN